MALNNVEMLTRKNEELQELLNKLERDTENMEIDEAVVTTAPLYNQLVFPCYIDWCSYYWCLYYLKADNLQIPVVTLLAKETR